MKERDTLDIDLKDIPINDSLKMYLNEIRDYPKLTVEEQKELALKKDFNRLINCNLKLVVSIAITYYRRVKHFQLLDLIQEGNVGLVRACETYDPSKAAFTTYAENWIHGKIRRAINEREAELRLPIGVYKLMQEYKALQFQNDAKGLPKLKDEDACQKLNISLERLKDIKLAISGGITSMNQPLTNDSDVELSEFLEDKNNKNEDEIVNDMHERDLLLVLKSILNPYNYYILYYRTITDKPKTLEEICDLFGVTREAIRIKQQYIYEKIKPYFDNSNSLFNKKLKEIYHNAYGKEKLLKTTPIEPLDVIKYLYVKNDLTKEEAKLYGLYLLGNYYYTDEDYARMLNTRIENLNKIKESLKNKLINKFQETKEFQDFSNEMIKKYGSSIYKKIDIQDESIDESNESIEDKEIHKTIKDKIKSYYTDESSNINEEKYFDMMIYLKNILTKLQFYILYVLDIKDNPKTFADLSKELNVYIGNIQSYHYSVLKKLNKVFIDNENELNEEIMKNKVKYGYSYYLLKSTPSSPSDVLKYLYLKNDLTNEERFIYGLELLGNYHYEDVDYSRILNVSLEDIHNIKQSLQDKIANKFSNSIDFQKFQDENMEKHRGYIYRFSEVDDNNLVFDVEREYDNYSLEEVMSLFNKVNYELSMEEINLLKEYFIIYDDGVYKLKGKDIMNYHHKIKTLLLLYHLTNQLIIKENSYIRHK